MTVKSIILTRDQLEKVWNFFGAVRLDERCIPRPSDSRSFEQLFDNLGIQKDKCKVSADGETFVILALPKPRVPLLTDDLVLCSGRLQDRRAIDIAAKKYGLEPEIAKGTLQSARRFDNL
jgi:hypothetical protein